MKIETKYDIGQEVWLNHFREMSIARISHIDIYVNKYGSVKPMYWVVIPPSDMPIFKYEEKELFPPKKNYLKVCRI